MALGGMRSAVLGRVRTVFLLGVADGGLPASPPPGVLIDSDDADAMARLPAWMADLMVLRSVGR